jgi:hypothetical protein
VLCAAFIGMALEGLVIDSDHWRHFFLLMGMIWGVALGTSRRAQPRSEAGSRRVQPKKLP